ncbi:MAG TPA: hypothetical protein VGD91_10885 [Trebonia sp.]
MTSTGPPPARPRRRGRRLAWRIGWVLLALVSFGAVYAVLVIGGAGHRHRGRQQRRLPAPGSRVLLVDYLELGGPA